MRKNAEKKGKLTETIIQYKYLTRDKKGVISEDMDQKVIMSQKQS